MDFVLQENNSSRLDLADYMYYHTMNIHQKNTVNHDDDNHANNIENEKGKKIGNDFVFCFHMLTKEDQENANKKTFKSLTTIWRGLLFLPS